MTPGAGLDTPEQFGRLTLGSFGLVLAWCGIAGMFCGIVLTFDYPISPRIFIPGGFCGVFMLGRNLLSRRELTLGPSSLLARSWFGVLRRKRPAELWYSPTDAWVGRRLHGEWVAARSRTALGLFPWDERRFRAACEIAGIPVQDRRGSWQRSHSRLNALRSILAASGAILLSTFAGVYLLWPRPLDWGPIPVGILVGGFALWFAAEGVVSVSD